MLTVGRSFRGLNGNHVGFQARLRLGHPLISAIANKTRTMIRVELPYHLRRLADIDREVTLTVDGPATQRAVFDSLEARHPELRGTIRDHVTKLRRPYIRLYACNRDLSNEPPDAPLPDSVANGSEPLMVIGALAGG